MRKLLTFLTIVTTLLLWVSCSSDSSSGPKATKANLAMGEYYGDIEENGNGNFYLLLVSGKLDNKEEIVGPGSGLMLDIYSALAADPSNASLVPGTYNVAETMAQFTLFPGEYDGEDYFGSIYVVSDESGNYTFDEIVSGSVDVAKSGTIYTITARLKTKSGLDVNYLYTGAIVFKNYAPFPQPDGVIAGYADMYITINYDLHFYKGTLNDKMDIVGDGYRLFFETFSPDMYEDRYEMPVGEYVAADGIDFADWSFARGEWGADNKLRSSQLMQYKNGVKTAIPVVGGTINVARTGTIYTITVDVWLDNDSDLTFVYTGAIEFEDMNP